MLEYSAVLGNDLAGWLGNVEYLIAAVLASPWFWPGVAAGVAVIVVVARLFSR